MEHVEHSDELGRALRVFKFIKVSFQLSGVETTGELIQN